MKAKFVKESIANDMSESSIEVKPYPQMSVEEFNERLSKLGEYFYDENHEFIMDQMVNNEEDTDEDLTDYLITNGVNPDFVAELIPMREYFWDFEYNQHINF